MQDLQGKVAVVAGGAGWVGRTTAAALAKAGMRVVVADVDRAAAHAVATEIGGLAVATDVSDLGSTTALAERVHAEMGGVHVVVNSAAVSLTMPLHEMGAGQWARLRAVNVGGVVNSLLAFLPRMRAAGDEGHFVNVASMAGLVPVSGQAAFSATQSAIVGLSGVLRKQMARQKIGVTVVCSGANGNGGGTAHGDAAPLGDRVRAAIVENRPFVVLTHDPAARRAVEARFRAMAAAHA